MEKHRQFTRKEIVGFLNKYRNSRGMANKPTKMSWKAWAAKCARFDVKKGEGRRGIRYRLQVDHMYLWGSRESQYAVVNYEALKDTEMWILSGVVPLILSRSQWMAFIREYKRINPVKEDRASMIQMREQFKPQNFFKDKIGGKGP